ncbi:Golgi nucleoside diphosphatase [Ordospora colligata OC4]|uniref:guanosine-diphosphatase n=1 Tax=Ordospora colligata OC4 TaxID=1354746 RepID=A0A0B2UK14_9MICR|nr:Golgi nucleoside diphosphatase [Ordospora colligata OC4]KHN69387.1 Golgi nucleoside diphosphatase [Ordospora colligata OC4]TBU14901.1 Golgi nucleoside diphosphatase [Ordospora colligata]
MHVSVLVCVLYTSVVLAISSSIQSAPSTGMTYTAVIDAGSTGTRLEVYGFVGQEIRHQGLFTNTPGIASMEEDSKIKSSLEELLMHAQPFYNNIKTIPMGFYGTAGLRALDTTRTDHILELIRNELNEYNLKEAKIVSGDEEGRLALMSLLISSKEMGNNNNKTVGVVDMGGASTQVSVLKNNGEILSDSINLGITAINNADDMEDCAVNSQEQQESCAQKIIAKLLNVQSRPILNNIDSLYLLSYFHDEFTKIVRGTETNMREIKDQFYKKCSLLDSSDCRNIFYLISFINALGINDLKDIKKIDTNNGINISWASAKGYELNKIYNK